MKILHTADWHLGRRHVGGRNIHEDQVEIIRQIVKYTKDHEPDVVIVAGDIYDTSNPPMEAMNLFAKTVHTIMFIPSCKLFFLVRI